MTRSDWGRIRLRSISSLLMMLLLFAGVLLIPASPAQAGLPDAPPDLLQRTAAGHVLGFQPDSLAVVGGNHAYRVEFAGAAPVTPVADASASAQGKSGSLGRVSYPGLWPGITLFYDKTNGGILRSTYLLQPGADPAHIRLRYNAPVHLEPDGSLRIEYARGLMRESAPAAWQDIDGRRVPVAVAFRLAENPAAGPEVGFSLGPYNPAHPLTIDPVLQWNTFLGGTGDDAATAMAMDSTGNVYVTGLSSSAWWGTNPVRPFTEGESDAFIAKLDGSGALLWHTFLGGSGIDIGTGIAVDGSGNVYASGFSNADWNLSQSVTPANPYTSEFDAFAVKLDPGGSALWQTFLGTFGDDRGYALAINDNNVYVTGGSANTWGSPEVEHGGALADAFVVSLNGNDGNWQWNTFMGAAGDTAECLAWAIAADSDNNVVVVGDSTVSWGTNPVNVYAGGYDVFAAKLNNLGVRQWHTFLGGTGTDYGYSVAVDVNGNIFVAGESYAAWGSNPVSSFTPGGTSDAFAVKLDSTGHRQWHAFLGGTGFDYGSSIAVDASGNVYLGGGSSAAWGNPINNFTGMIDAFVAKLDNGGVLRKNSFTGGTGQDYGDAILLAGEDIVYVAGETFATWGRPVRPFTPGGSDAYVAKLHLYKFPWAMFLPALNPQQ